MIIKKRKNITHIQGTQINGINYKCCYNIYKWHIKSSMVKKVHLYQR